MIGVHITIDTEFSAGGYFSNPDTCVPVTDQAVFCNVDGRSHGLGFLLQTFAEFRIRGTFFIEAAHTLMLGSDPMRPAVDAILAAGHDVQLHIHPMWLAAEGGRRPIAPVADSIGSLDEDTCKRLIECGQKAFRTWGAPAPLAFRAGNLDMGRAAYRALKACGIRISSSIGIAIHAPSDAGLWIESGRRRIEGVMEIPVLAYADLTLGDRRHMKNLTVTGCGSREVCAVLRAAETRGLEDAVLLTHPFEFIKQSRFRPSRLTGNRINQHRLQHLCQFLASSDGTFRSATFADMAERWLQHDAESGLPLFVPFSAALMRVIENKLNDAIWWY